MLARAAERVGAATNETVRTLQADIREVSLPSEHYDIIMAAAVLHHLRSDAEWEQVLSKLRDALEPDGSLWVSDLVDHTTDAVRTLMWQRYGNYLTELEGPAYRRNQVFEYIEQEDSPRPLTYQIDSVKEAGFSALDILHKNSMFAAFGAVK